MNDEDKQTYKELYEDMPYIAEMGFTWHDIEYVWGVNYGEVALWDCTNDIRVFCEFYQGETPDYRSEEHAERVMKFFDAKIFEGKTFEEIISEIPRIDLTYGCEGKYS